MPFGQTKVHTHAHFKTFFFCLLSYFLHFLLPFRSSVAAYKEYSRVPGPRDKRLWAKLQRLSLVTPPHKIHISHCPRHYGLMPRREREEKKGKEMSQAFVYKQRQCQKRPDSIESLVQENTGSCPSSLHKTLAVPSEKLWRKKKKKSSLHDCNVSCQLLQRVFRKADTTASVVGQACAAFADRFAGLIRKRASGVGCAG